MFGSIDTNDSEGVSCQSENRSPVLSPWSLTSDLGVVMVFVFFVAVFGPSLCCVFIFAMWVSVRVGHFDRSAVRLVGLCYPVPGFVLTVLVSLSNFMLTDLCFSF